MKGFPGKNRYLKTSPEENRQPMQLFQNTVYMFKHPVNKWAATTQKQDELVTSIGMFMHSE